MRPVVLHLSTLPLEQGGIERFLLNLSAHLSEHYRMIIASGAEDLFRFQAQKAGIHTIYWKTRSFWDRELLHILEEIRPDIIHLHDARTALLVRPLLRQRGQKIVYTVHLPPYYYRWPRFNHFRQKLYALIERMLNYLFTDVVIYPSRKSWEEALRKSYAPKEKAVCIPNGIDLASFLDQQAQPNGENPIICTVARLSPEKNIIALLKAAAILKKRYLSFRLWIIGSGPQKTPLEIYAHDLGLSDCTQFWGVQSHIPMLLSQVHLFTLPSHYEGGRTQAVMEAQAAGLPCVLSDVGDHAWMVENPLCGYVFSPEDVFTYADLLESLLRSPNDRASMGQLARQKAFQEYDLENMIKEYDRIYDSLHSL